MVVNGPLRKEVEGKKDMGVKIWIIVNYDHTIDKPPPQGENGLLVSFVRRQLTRFEHIDLHSL